MKPSSFQTAIRLQFDCLVKRVIDTTVKDYQRELSRRATHEIAFSELPEQELSHVGITDDYDSDYSCFEVLGTKVKVNNEQLADALKILPEKKLDILLMFYFPSEEYLGCLMTEEQLMFYDEINTEDLFEGKNDREKILIFSVD